MEFNSYEDRCIPQVLWADLNPVDAMSCTCGLPGEFCAGRVALSCVSPFLSCRLKLVLLGISGKPEPPYRDHCLGTERLSYPMPADNDLFCFTSFCK